MQILIIGVANTFHSSQGQLSSFPLYYLHSPASLWSVTTSQVTPDFFLMGQQWQAKTFHELLVCSKVLITSSQKPTIQSMKYQAG